MTRKDFQLIADAVQQMNFPDNHVERKPTKAHVARTLADRLALTNDRFDREKFLAACGVK